MSQEIDKRLERVLSKERLGGYQTQRAQRYDCHPLSLYRWNSQLSESLYPLLQTIEVILRNAIYVSISEHFQDPHWLKNRKILDLRDWVVVQKQETRLLEAGKQISPGGLVAMLSFGFWTRLLDARYEMKFWRSKIIKKTFPHMLPRNRTRHTLSQHFNKIRKLRNRVFHHEPIWYWRDLKEQYEGIRMAISWVEPSALSLCTPDRFLSLYLGGPERVG